MMLRTLLSVSVILAIAVGVCDAAPERLASDETRRDSTGASDSYANTIAQAAQLIAQSQINTSSPFNPPWSLEQTQDIFPSFIGLNLVGKPLNSTLRHLFQIFDNNAFVSNWVAQMQLECAKLGVVGLTDAAALRTVNLTLAFQEHLVPASTGAMDFWSEQLRNGSWQQWPTNLATPITWTMPIAQKLAAWCATTPSVCALVQPIIAEMENLQDFLSSFGIPADFDDSSVNLALGLLLSQLQVDLPESWALWSQAPGNVDPTPLFELYTQFAYQPFSEDSDQNSIDPRSYYYLREFLYQAAEQAAADGVSPSLMLIPTWLDSISSSDRNYAKHHKMPFLVNNVDGSVVSNSVFGILSSIMMAAPWDGTGTYGSFLSPALSQLLQNSTALMSWIVDTEILSTRGDIVLLYYPPVSNFYFFAARSLKLLESTDIESLFTGVYNDPSTAKLLLGLRSTLSSALRSQGTATLLSQATWITNPDGSAGAVFDEFLGNADTDAEGNPTPRHEDRLYTTAMVANALLASWTTATATPVAGKGSPVETLSWVAAVPAKVQSTVHAACAFLNDALVSGALLPSNAFFSGSVKGATTLPFNYPINRWQYANGTTVSWQSVSWDLISDDLGLAFSGVIPEADYQSMMSAQNNPLGVQTPTAFGGYDVDGIGMVYWSSQQMTHAAGMFTLAQCSVLANQTANL